MLGLVGAHRTNDCKYIFLTWNETAVHPVIMRSLPLSETLWCFQWHYYQHPVFLQMEAKTVDSYIINIYIFVIIIILCPPHAHKIQTLAQNCHHVIIHHVSRFIYFALHCLLGEIVFKKKYEQHNIHSIHGMWSSIENLSLKAPCGDVDSVTPSACFCDFYFPIINYKNKIKQSFLTCPLVSFHFLFPLSPQSPVASAAT